MEDVSRPRGFAAMDPARQREISSRGGRAAQAGRRAHRWTSDTAREASRKGKRPHDQQPLTAPAPPTCHRAIRATGGHCVLELGHTGECLS